MSLHHKICHIIILLFILTSNGVKSQQLPIYSLHLQNPSLLNPATVGIEDFIDIKVGARKQWIGIKGAPSTYYLSANTTISADTVVDMYRQGTGGVIWFDKAGALSQTSFLWSYSYHKYVTAKTAIAFGVSAGINYTYLDKKDLNVIKEDPFIQNASNSNLSPDLSLGALYYSRNYYIGLSFLSLFPGSLYRLSGDINDKNGDLVKARGKRSPHSYLSMGYRKDLDLFEAAPSLTITAIPNQPISIDYNLKLIFEDTFWAGASYRSSNSFIIMAGLYLDSGMSFAYAYDFNFFNFSHFYSGSHEIVLGFQIYNVTDKCPKFIW